MQTGPLTYITAIIVVMVASIPLVIELLNKQDYLGLTLSILGIIVGLAIPFIMVWISNLFNKDK